MTSDTLRTGKCRVCGAESMFWCSFCGEECYCTYKHLEEDWPRHSKTCKKTNVPRPITEYTPSPEDYATNTPSPDLVRAGPKRPGNVEMNEEPDLPIDKLSVSRKRRNIVPYSKEEIEIEEKKEEMIVDLMANELDKESYENTQRIESQVKEDNGVCLGKDDTEELHATWKNVGFSDSIDLKDWNVLTENPVLLQSISRMKLYQSELKLHHCSSFVDHSVISKIILQISKKEKKTRKALLTEWKFVEVFRGFVDMYKAFAHVCFISDPESIEDVTLFAKFAADTYYAFVQYMEYICHYIQCLNDFMEHKDRRDECLKTYTEKMLKLRKELGKELESFSRRVWNKTKKATKKVLSAIVISIKWTCQGAMMLSEAAANASGAQLLLNGSSDSMFNSTLEYSVNVLQSYGIPVWPSLQEFMPGSGNVFGVNIVGFLNEYYAAQSAKSLAAHYPQWALVPVMNIASGAANAALLISWKTMQIVNAIHAAFMLSTNFVCDTILESLFPNHIHLAKAISPFASWILLGCATALAIKFGRNIVPSRLVYGIPKRATRKAKNLWGDWLADEKAKKLIREAMESYMGLLNMPTTDFEAEFVLDVNYDETF